MTITNKIKVIEHPEICENTGIPGKSHNNNICCLGCFRLGIEEGKRQEKDIKADHLAGHYISGKEEEQKRIINLIKLLSIIPDEDFIFLKQQIQNQSQKNPITTAEGVKIGRKSRITPKVVPEKVLTQSSDNIFQKEIEADAKRLNEIYDKNGKK